MDRIEYDSRKSYCEKANTRRLQNGTYLCNNVHTPEMATLLPRLKTFIAGWPNHLKATPREIAAAGFFYLGQRDRVKCFCCNGGLQNWHFTDEPWFEHAKWYPHCEYLLKSKGQKFVQEVSERFPTLQRPFPKLKPRTCTSNDVEPNRNHYNASAVLVAADSSGRTSAQNTECPSHVTLQKAMQSEVVINAGMFGFDKESVTIVVKRKLEISGKEYSSVKELVSDLQQYEASEDRDHQRSATSSAQPAAAGFVLMSEVAGVQ